MDHYEDVCNHMAFLITAASSYFITLILVIGNIMETVQSPEHRRSKSVEVKGEDW